MAFVATMDTAEPRSFSIGPMKAQRFTWAAASGDTSGTITLDRLSEVDFVIIVGLEHSAAPTYATNVATLAFTDPVATVYGTGIAFGR